MAGRKQKGAAADAETKKLAARERKHGEDEPDAPLVDSSAIGKRKRGKAEKEFSTQPVGTLVYDLRIRS